TAPRRCSRRSTSRLARSSPNANGGIGIRNSSPSSASWTRTCRRTSRCISSSTTKARTNTRPCARGSPAIPAFTSTSRLRTRRGSIKWSAGLPSLRSARFAALVPQSARTNRPHRPLREIVQRDRPALPVDRDRRQHPRQAPTTYPTNLRDITLGEAARTCDRCRLRPSCRYYQPRGWPATSGTVKGCRLRRQSASSRSDPPTAQGLDRQNNRERADHPEEVQDPHEEQGATLLEKLWAQAVPHVQWHHREGYHAAKQHDHLTRSPFSQQHGAAEQDEQVRDADKLVQSAAVEAEDDVLGDVQRKEDYGE